MKLCGYKIGGAICFAVAGWMLAVASANAEGHSPVINLGELQRLSNICTPYTEKEVVDRLVEQDTAEDRGILQKIDELWKSLGKDKSSELQDFALAAHARKWCLADKRKPEFKSPLLGGSPDNPYGK